MWRKREVVNGVSAGAVHGILSRRHFPDCADRSGLDRHTRNYLLHIVFVTGVDSLNLPSTKNARRVHSSRESGSPYEPNGGSYGSHDGRYAYGCSIIRRGRDVCWVCIWMVEIVDNSIIEPWRGMKAKFVVMICLFALVPNLAFCQQEDQPDLPEQSAEPSGFILDQLQHDNVPGADPSLVPLDATPLESQAGPTDQLDPLDQSILWANPGSRQFLPGEDTNLFPGLLPEANVNEITPPLLLATPVRQSLARSWEGEGSQLVPLSAQRPYNLKLGDASFWIGGSLGLEWNDNIFASETNRQADMIFQPALQVSTAIRLSNENSIQLNLGIGYQAYVQHSDQDTMSLSPGSQIAFNIYTGDFKIQLHDQFSLEQDPVSQPGLNNTANAGVFTNSIGGIVLWNLNKMVLELDYDHTNTISTQSNAGYPDQSGDNISLAATFDIHSSVKTGLQSEVEFTNYAQSAGTQFQDSHQLRLGPFVEWRLTDNTSLRAEAGYLGTFVDQGGVGAVSSDPLDWYGDLAVSQNINSHISHTLSIGRDASGGLTSSVEQIEYLRHAVAWNIVDKVGLGTILYLEKDNESGGSNPEKATRYGAGINLSWHLNSKITVSSQYQFIYKDSDVNGNSYTQNQVLLNFSYQY